MRKLGFIILAAYFLFTFWYLEGKNSPLNNRPKQSPVCNCK